VEALLFMTDDDDDVDDHDVVASVGSFDVAENFLASFR